MTSGHRQGDHGPAEREMHYLQSVRLAFEQPDWILNLVIGSVCVATSHFIPVVGQMVWMGYVFEVIEALHRRPNDLYPSFTFDKFSDYVLRGLWWFLVSLIGSAAILPLVLAIVVAGFLCSGVAAAAIGDDAGAAAFAIVMVFVALVGTLVYFFGILLLIPFVLRAGLTQDLGKTFDFAFAKDFVARVWKEMIVAGCFWLVVLLASMLAGTLALCIGIYPAMAVAMMAQGHLLLQLYELYLSRGGEPIPLKPVQP